MLLQSTLKANKGHIVKNAPLMEVWFTAVANFLN